MIRYEWDNEKNSINKAKHGVSFEDAEQFDWETSVSEIDDRMDYGEIRINVLGLIDGRLHVLVYTPRPPNVRIIGLRRANDRERKFYDTY